MASRRVSASFNPQQKLLPFRPSTNHRHFLTLDPRSSITQQAKPFLALNVLFIIFLLFFLGEFVNRRHALRALFQNFYLTHVHVNASIRHHTGSAWKPADHYDRVKIAIADYDEPGGIVGAQLLRTLDSGIPAGRLQNFTYVRIDTSKISYQVPFQYFYALLSLSQYISLFRNKSSTKRIRHKISQN